MPTPRYRSILHAVDPYQGFDHAAHPVDMQGWAHLDPVFPRLINFLRPRLILEFGTWKGGSAITMARALKSLNISGEIICIDTWLGSSEHVLPESEWHESMRYRNGYPQIYYTFLANVIHSELEEYITPFAATTEVGYYIFKRLGVHAPLIYVDASHEFPSVVRDILGVWQLMTEKGVLLGDDYDWPEVREAVGVAVGQLKRSNETCYMYNSGSKYILSRRPLMIDLLSGRLDETQPT